MRLALRPRQLSDLAPAAPQRKLVGAAARLRANFAAEAGAAADYFAQVAPRLPLFAALYLLLVYLLRGAARRSLGEGARDASQDRVAAVVELPYSSALLLTVLAAAWADPTSPRVVREFLAVAALPPIVRILYRIVDPHLRRTIDVLAALFLADRVRALCYAVPLSSRCCSSPRCSRRCCSCSGSSAPMSPVSSPPATATIR